MTNSWWIAPWFFTRKVMTPVGNVVRPCGCRYISPSITETVVTDEDLTARSLLEVGDGVGDDGLTARDALAVGGDVACASGRPAVAVRAPTTPPKMNATATAPSFLTETPSDSAHAGFSGGDDSSRQRLAWSGK